jgi:hypothetical protein
VQVDHTGERKSAFVRLAEEGGDFFQNVCVGLVGVVEARRVD